VLSLTDHLGQDVLAADGGRVGSVADLAFRFDDVYPLVTGLVTAERRGARRYVPWELVESFERSAVCLRVPTRLLRAAELADDELLLCQHVLDGQIFDAVGKRLARVGDVELDREDGLLRVVAVDVGASPLLRRLGLRRTARRVRVEAVDWKDLHVMGGRGHALQAGAPNAALYRLGPAELAELMARLPVQQGAELLGHIGAQPAARALSAARPELGGQLVRELDPETAAAIVTEMPADDATAALRHVEPEQLERTLAELGTTRTTELRRLLAAPARTAAGLMTTDVRTARVDEPAETIRSRLAARPPHHEALTTVFVVGADGKLAGSIPPSRLLAGDATPLPVPTLTAETPLAEVLDLFAVHDVLALPVVDGDGRIIGAVGVDDVLEELLVERLPGRRRFAILGRLGRARS
jgi:magnesium transporter